MGPAAIIPGSSAIASCEEKFSATWPEAAAGVEFRTVEAGDAGGFLPAVLQRVKAERGRGCRIGSH